MANEQMEDNPTSMAIREMQVKTTTGTISHPSGIHKNVTAALWKNYSYLNIHQ